MLGNNLFYQQLYKKVFSRFAPTLGSSYKYQSKGLKKKLMKHMTTLFG